MKKDIAIWLFVVAGFVALMVLVGGLTRLTDSGLSITEWQPIAGIVPPLDDAAWAQAFAKYKSIPQYELVNAGMSLAEFKIIYWWEWSHRALGRLVGLVFVVPFIYFIWRRRISPREMPPLLALFALGAGQGLLGWYMVQSGLVERVDVSSYRLAAHLGLALIIFVAAVWLGLRYWYGGNFRRLNWQAAAILVLIFAQSLVGALLAGVDGGKIYNEFPLLDGAWLPDNLFAPAGGRDVLTDPLSVQFLHRSLAYVLVLLAAWHCWSGGAKRGKALLAVIFAQAALGVATLLYVAPLPLAAAHQIGAVLALLLATQHLFFSQKNY